MPPPTPEPSASCRSRARRLGALVLPLGAVVAGVALFVVAAASGPAASGHTALSAHPAAHGSPLDVMSMLGGQRTPSGAHPARAAAAAHPAVPATHARHAVDTAKRQAPATPAVISGLAANGIPAVALNAYRVAAARMADVDPGCGVDWALLAGIGREESDHGQFAGAVLHADGVSTPPIVGPALDGTHWDYIPAPANGAALDGDTTYAHALGPMQFIPSTWAEWGTDADGDGTANIFDINDAALSAARYLCAAGGDLRTRSGQVAAVLAYNHNSTYLAQVLALADAYRTGTPVTGIPVGITSGPLPKVSDPGYLPPVNPGAPTAVGGGRHHRHHGTRHGSTGRRHHRAAGTGGTGGTEHHRGHQGAGHRAHRSHHPTAPSSPASSPMSSPSRSHSPSPSPTLTSSAPGTPLPSLPLPTPTCITTLLGKCVSLP